MIVRRFQLRADRSFLGEPLSALPENLVLFVGLIGEDFDFGLHFADTFGEFLVGAGELLDGGLLVAPEEAG